MVDSAPKIVAIIQARVGSSRLPGKVLMNIAGKTVLEHIVERTKSSKLIGDIIIATSDQRGDDRIADISSSVSVNCFRGNEKRVLDRFVRASAKVRADVVVRLTGDNIFVDGSLIDLALIEFLTDYPDLDYLGNTDSCGFPFGLYVEVVRADVLAEISENADDREQEHVTIKVRNNLSLFRVKRLEAQLTFPNINLSIDTAEDYTRVKKIFEKLYNKNQHFSMLEISALRANDVC